MQKTFAVKWLKAKSKRKRLSALTQKWIAIATHVEQFIASHAKEIFHDWQNGNVQRPGRGWLGNRLGGGASFVRSSSGWGR
ncbi:MAG: hypothetical protein WAO21_12965 [Verrucomicrobiia bacterium]|jgi:hypothetical protein